MPPRVRFCEVLSGAYYLLSDPLDVIVLAGRQAVFEPLLFSIFHQVGRWDAAPGGLVLEVTERGLLADPVGAAENLKKLRALGVRLSIDDFGSGYSSLASLNQRAKLAGSGR